MGLTSPPTTDIKVVDATTPASSMKTIDVSYELDQPISQQFKFSAYLSSDEYFDRDWDTPLPAVRDGMVQNHSYWTAGSHDFKLVLKQKCPLPKTSDS